MKDLKTELREFIARKKAWWRRLLLSGRREDLRCAVFSDGRFARYPDFDFDLETMCYWIVNGLYDFPKCANPGCGRPIEKNVSYRDGYAAHCCVRCAQLDGAVREKISRTNAERYGASCSLRGAAQLEKARRTCLERYGTDSPNRDEGVKARQRRACLERHGAEKPLQSAEVRVRQRATMLERYGAPTSWQAGPIKARMRETVVRRYGTDSVSRDEGVRRRKRETCLERYGVEYPQQSAEVRAKTARTNMERYGARSPAQNRQVMLRARRRYEYGGESFDSAPELAFYIWLSDRGEPFRYHPDAFFRYFDGKTERRYFPDFEVGGVYYELKGDQFFGPDGTARNPYDRSLDYVYEAKRRCAVENGVRILRSRDYVKYLDYVRGRYGARFLEGFRKKPGEAPRAEVPGRVDYNGGSAPNGWRNEHGRDMTEYERLQGEIKKAMVAGDGVRRDCLRGLLSDVKNRTVNEGKPVTDDAVAAAAARAVKARRESIGQFEAAGRTDLAEKEKRELELLSAFAPATLSEEETRRLVDAAVKALRSPGVGDVMKSLPKNADRRFAASYAREVLSGRA